MISRQPKVCPTCGNMLPGLGTFCHMCGAYVEDMGPEQPKAKPTLPDDRTEAQVQLAIRRAAELLGYEAFDLSQGRPTRQPSGIPDLYIRGHGRRVWVEVKRPHGGKLSEAQHQFITGELGNGGDAFVARSEQDFIAWHLAREAA